MPVRLTALLARELTLVFRRFSDSAISLIFALLVVALFPFALSPEPAVLQNLAPGLVLIAVLLAHFLQMEKSFADDYASGALDQMILSGLPLPLYVGMKYLAQILGVTLPLLLACPFFLMLLQVNIEAMPLYLAALALASLILALLGLAGSALTLGSRQAGLLLALVLIPFAIPVLIFAASFARNGLASGEGAQALLFLGALFFLYLALVPFLAAAALKAAGESA